MNQLDKLAAEHEFANGSEVVTRYGIGAVSFEERLNGYVLRYEAETVPQLIELMAKVNAEQRRQKDERNANTSKEG